MGVFSLNYHKHIHTGEGGVVVTNNDEFAERLQLIRNHAEVVVRGKGVNNLINMVGFNYRMTEIEAAIGSEQLKKLQHLVEVRQAHASYLTEKLKSLPGITPPVVRPESTHAYYVYPIRYDELFTGVTRERFAEALRAEGIPVGLGYVRPIYLEPMYQQRIALGREGFPFTYSGYKGVINYEPGICPTAEKMHFQELICGDFCHSGLSFSDLEDIVAAFEKVFNNLDELQKKAN
jgi:perosamine synthetase